MITKSANLCIYHANCNDGVLAAAIVKKRMKYLNQKIEFHPMNYNDDFTLIKDKINSKTNVYFVDFSLPRAEMLTIAHMANSITIYDHHVSAKDNLHEIDRQDSSIACIFDMNRSGAGITWDELYPDDKRPIIIDIIEDRDLWKMENPLTKPITSIIRDGGMSLETWERYLDYSEEDINDLAISGSAVELHNGINNKIEADKQLRNLHVINLDAIPSFHVFNSTTQVSEQLNVLLKHKDYEHDVAVSYRIVDRKLQCSARSIDGKSALEVAKHFGGGGHGNASGYCVTIKDAVQLGFF